MNRDDHTGRPDHLNADPPSQGGLDALDEFVASLAPSMFELGAEPANPADSHTIAWGLEFPDQVVVLCTPEGDDLGTFPDHHHALRIFVDPDAALHVIWHAAFRRARPPRPNQPVSRYLC
jgi:hypothetical protein